MKWWDVISYYWKNWRLLTPELCIVSKMQATKQTVYQKRPSGMALKSFAKLTGKYLGQNPSFCKKDFIIVVLL